MIGSKYVPPALRSAGQEESDRNNSRPSYNHNQRPDSARADNRGGWDSSNG